MKCQLPLLVPESTNQVKIRSFSAFMLLSICLLASITTDRYIMSDIGFDFASMNHNKKKAYGMQCCHNMLSNVHTNLLFLQQKEQQHKSAEELHELGTKT